VTGVLVVAPRGDRHGDAVQQALVLAGATVARTAIDTSGMGFVARPPAPPVLGGQSITGEWTVWWHRTGTLPPVPGADPAEQALAQAEGAALLTGALLAVGPTWVDEPAAVERAEHNTPFSRLRSRMRAGRRSRTRSPGPTRTPPQPS